MKDPYWMAADCPNCGEKDAPGQWKGARMGSTAWGHSYSCCSDACGIAFATSPKRYQMEIAALDEEIGSLTSTRRELVKRLMSAKGKLEPPNG